VLLTSAKLREFNKDEQILGQGVKNYNLFRIKSGVVRIEINGNFIATLGMNEIFGELSFLGRYTTSAAVVAHEQCMLYTIEMKIVRAIFVAGTQRSNERASEPASH